MRIRLASIPVTGADQDKAVTFYTEKLGFRLGRDIPVGEARFVTVVSPEEPDGPELLIEPAGDHAATKVWREALYAEGIPVTALCVEDIASEYQTLTARGVGFKGEPFDIGDSIAAVLDDTCGNLVMIYQEKDAG